MDAVGPQTLAVAVGPIVRRRPARTTTSGPSPSRWPTTRRRSCWSTARPAGSSSYLRNALARDPRVTVESVVFRQPKAGAGGDPTYKTALPAEARPAAEGPRPTRSGRSTRSSSATSDPAAMPAEAWARLDAYVAERGGTLIVVPGPRRWPAPMLGMETVRKLLPVLDPRPSPADPAASPTPRTRACPPARRSRRPPRRRPKPGRCSSSPPTRSRAGRSGRACPACPGRSPARPSRAPPSWPRRRHRPRRRRGRHRRAAVWAGQGPVGRHRRHLALAAPGRRRLSPPLLGPGGPLGDLGQAGRRQRPGPVRPGPPEAPRRGRPPRSRPASPKASRASAPTSCWSPASSRPSAGTSPPKSEGEAVAVVPLRPVPGQPRTFAASRPRACRPAPTSSASTPRSSPTP